MRAFPLDYHCKGTAIATSEEQKGAIFLPKVVIFEPKSVLDQRSPSPPTSSSTLSSSLAGAAAVSAKPPFKWPTAEDWPPELHPVPAPLMDWEDTLLPESAAQEHTFLRWITGDADDPAAKQQQHLMLSSPMPMEQFDSGIPNLGFGLIDPAFGFESNASASSPRLDVVAHCDKNPFFTTCLPPPMFFHEQTEEKSQLYGQFQPTQVAASPAFLVPLPPFSSPVENLLAVAPPSAGSELFPRPQSNQNMNFAQLHPAPYHLQHRPLKPKSLSGGDDAVAIQQALVDQLFKAAELVEGANMVGAHGILARLNHQLPSPIGKPFLRSAFYFKEALQLLVNSANPLAATSSPSHHRRTPFASPLATPLDVVLKLSAYKAFSEVSPILQFTNFTATQALLEELGAADCIHIIDFDIGVGGQWSSFMQELAQHRSSAAAISLLKITAFVSPYSFHPLELHLTKENLSHFAAELNIPFEINIASIESFDPAEILVLSAGSNEAIAVNLPVGIWHCPSFPTLLRLVKQLLPKIVISTDQGCDRSDLHFPHYLINALQSCVVLLDSFDGAGTDQDVTSKIERFVLQPRIENCVIGRHCTAEKMLPWRTLFASAGFVPFQFSNFTETQAECLLKRVQVRGFHVEKRQASLYLYWQRGELASVSAWRC